MPRKPRFFLPDMPVHAMQRGADRGAVFFYDQDYLEYLRILKQSADLCRCQVHAYVLMTNHIHLLLTPDKPDSLGKLFQAIGRHYVPYVNETYQRTGGLWEGRYKSSLVDSQNYLLRCMRYIEMNPVRAGMVKSPSEYRWSSYAANALGDSNFILTPHEEYLQLSSLKEKRLAIYQSMFTELASEDGWQAIRESVQTGTPVGSDRFKQQIEGALGMKVGYSRRGRPRKRTELFSIN